VIATFIDNLQRLRDGRPLLESNGSLQR